MKKNFLSFRFSCLYKKVPYKTVQYKPVHYKTVRKSMKMNKKTVRYSTVRKTVPSNYCFIKLIGRELSFV